jgi:hypothetical protein
VDATKTQNGITEKLASFQTTIGLFDVSVLPRVWFTDALSVAANLAQHKSVSRSGLLSKDQERTGVSGKETA